MGINLENQVQPLTPLVYAAQAEPTDDELAANNFAIFPYTVAGKTELAVKGKDASGNVQPLAQLTTNGGQLAGDTNGTYVTYIYTIQSADATNKYFTLASTPKEPSLLTALIIDGPEQVNGVDFQISGASFEWTGLGLDPAVDQDGDGGLIAGDQILLVYFS